MVKIAYMVALCSSFGTELFAKEENKGSIFTQENKPKARNVIF